MATESSTGTKKVVPEIVKLDKAFKLAEMWVKNMSGGVEENKIDVEIEGRPSGLGLGARIAPNAKKAPSTDPVERKLLSKVNARRKQSSENEENLNSTEKNEFENDDSDEPESRTSAVGKKRMVPLSTKTALAKKRK